MDVVGKYEKAKKIMDECENSQLVLEKRIEHIKLAPKFLGNVRAGVHQQLTDKLLQRHQVLDGFPLAYTNVRALQQFGKIISDHTCIHFDIEADFIIFKPAVGQKLNAKINKISKRHIGCLVHNHFNAWTPHMSSTEKLSADILMGAEIEISVQEVSTDRNVVSIRGKFERFLSPDIENSRVLLITPLTESDKRKRKKKDADAAEKEQGTVIEQNTGIEDNDIVTPKKKKKHQKEGAELSQDGLSDTLKHDKDNLSVNGTLEEESPRKSKKKHKKEKRKVTEEDISLVNGALDIDNSIASLMSCEPLFTSTQVDDVNNNEGGKKKSKKHKKKHKVSNDTNDSEIDPDSLLHSDSLDPTTECSINESELTDSKHEIKHKKSRKRTHGESNFTLIKEKVVKQDLDFAEPSPVKKLKRQKKVVEIDMDSSADFEDTSKSRKKEKKKKKHKNKE